MEWLLALADLVSLVAGLAGTILLARAVDKPPVGGGDVMTGGRQYRMGYLFPERWKRGIGLIVIAFTLQMPKAILTLVRLCGR